MSYNAHPTMPGIEPSTLLLYDIAALQYLYGANTSTYGGDDNYAGSAEREFIAVHLGRRRQRHARCLATRRAASSST